jgi:uncharacterized membrane protein YqjE
MEPASPGPVGFLGSLRSLGDGLLATVQDRLKLVTVELQAEKLRLIQTFIWISAAFFTGMMAVMFASLALVYACWESHRLAVLGGLAAFYAGALAVIVIAFRRHLARRTTTFAATLDEIEEDRACIRKKN